ncbi:hypothetical protein H0H93_000407, partial [Arthromyces matolae]
MYRAAVLDAMQGAEMKLLRVFITRVAAGAKGSSAQAVNDLETVAVGSYDDTILTQIDQLAYEAHSRDIKLIVAMHDRYALGCWDTDAYVAKYNLPVTGCVNGVPDSSTFYTNSNAVADAIRQSSEAHFELPISKVWCSLASAFRKYTSDAIFSFEIENEAMGHMDQVAPFWWCGRANTIRSVLGSYGIQISTGGGTDFPTSTQSQFFT